MLARRSFLSGFLAAGAVIALAVTASREAEAHVTLNPHRHLVRSRRRRRAARKAEKAAKTAPK